MHEYFDYNPYRKEDSRFDASALKQVKEEKPKPKRKAPTKATAKPKPKEGEVGYKKPAGDGSKKKFSGVGRDLRIKACTDCNGCPPLEPFEIDLFKGNRCSICWEIVNHVAK